MLKLALKMIARHSLSLGRQRILIEAIARRLTSVGRQRIILDREGKEPYLERYYLLFKEQYRNCPFNALLHRPLVSDPEGLHDHPWNWGSFILAGGYWENTPEGRFWRGAGSFRFRRATALHRLEIDTEKAGGDTWTLFFVGDRHREWGFLDPEKGWVHWEQHLQERQKDSP